MRRIEHGFTLIEAVLVLLLLGILSIGLAAFIDNATDQYADTAERTRLLGEARLALTRMGREIQGALPYSLRTDSDGDARCLEFLPTRDGGRYQDSGGTYSNPANTPQQPLPVADRATSFHALGFTGVGKNLTQIDAGDAVYVAVYPVPPAKDYIYKEGSDPEPSADVALRRLSGVGSAPPQGVVEVRLAANTHFPRHAPEPHRFFLVGSPVSFCLEGGDLIRYEGYGLQAKQPLPPGGTGRPLARGLGAGSTFELEPAGLERRGLVRARLELEPQSDGGGPLTVEHAFSTRNHP